MEFYNTNFSDLTEDLNILYDFRKAAEAHRQVRRYAQSILQQDMTLIDFTNKLESMNRFLLK